LPKPPCARFIAGQVIHETGYAFGIGNYSKTRIVPTAPLLAQATLNIVNGTSVSSLFDEGTLGPIYDGYYKGDGDGGVTPT